MKSNILLAIAMVCTLAVMAQQPDRPMHRKGGKPGMEQGKGDRQKKMAQELNLTNEQQNQMKVLQEGFREKMKALKQNESITVKQQRDEMYDLQKQHRADMKKILTPEQQEKMNTIRTEQGKRMEQGQSRQFDRIAEELKLTESQKAQFTQLQAKHRTSMHAIMQNDNLDRIAKQNQVKALLDEHQRDITKLLSKDQQKQWDELKKNRPMHPKGPGRNGMGRPDFI